METALIEYIVAGCVGAWIIGTIALLRFWASRKLVKNGSGRAVQRRVRNVTTRCIFWPVWFVAIAMVFVGHLLMLACIGKKAREALKRNGKRGSR